MNRRTLLVFALGLPLFLWGESARGNFTCDELMAAFRVASQKGMLVDQEHDGLIQSGHLTRVASLVGGLCGPVCVGSADQIVRGALGLPDDPNPVQTIRNTIDTANSVFKINTAMRGLNSTEMAFILAKTLPEGRHGPPKITTKSLTVDPELPPGSERLGITLNRDLKQIEPEDLNGGGGQISVILVGWYNAAGERKGGHYLVSMGSPKKTDGYVDAQSLVQLVDPRDPKKGYEAIMMGPMKLVQRPGKYGTKLLFHSRDAEEMGLTATGYQPIVESFISVKYPTGNP